MLDFSTPDGGRIFLNLSREDRFDLVAPTFGKKVQSALLRVASLHRNGTITDDHIRAADIIVNEAVCLSPYTIFALHRGVCARLNDVSDFAWELRAQLDAVGALKFIEGCLDKNTATYFVERVLAVFSTSASGTTTLENTPTAFVHGVVDFFRSEDGLGWNKEIVASTPLYPQCLSNIVKGLARIFQDNSLLDKARKHRAARGKGVGWRRLERSQDAVDIELLRLHRAIAETSLAKPRDLRETILAISAWMKADYPGQTVSELFVQQSRGRSFAEFVKQRSNVGATKYSADLVNHARIFGKDALKQLIPQLGNVALFDLVTQNESNRIKNEVRLKPKPTRSAARPMPEKLVLLAKELLDEGEAGWPGKSGHFDVDLEQGYGTRRIFCPVIPTLFRVMLELPLRMVQLRRLDSGEGDVIRFNADSMDWEVNDGPLAGYWADQALQPRDNFPTRGYACKIVDGIKTISGVRVNTNKTGDPWDIPWVNEVFLKCMGNLRQWQEHFNPIRAPVPPENYQDYEMPPRTLAQMPSIFPIARRMVSAWTGRDVLVSSSEVDHAWKHMLIELQRRWNGRHPGNQVTLVEISKTGQPVRPRYTLHGFRRRGLTNFARGGMPLAMLSRFLAGHATVAMTIYYLDFHPTEIETSITLALANSEAQRGLIDDLKKMEIDEALRRTVSLSPSAITEAFESGSQFQFCNTELGICPYDGTRCSDGGVLLRKETKEGVDVGIYGAVAPRNCVMCRHFLSGPPWLNQLLAYGTKLCEQRQHLAIEARRIQDLLTRNEEGLKAGTITPQEYENAYDALQVEHISVQDKQEDVENSIFNVELLCNASVKLLDASEEPGIDLVANHRSSIVEFAEISEFEQSARITAAGRVHRILGDERVEAKRDKYLDLILWGSGITPPSLLVNISDKHRRKAMDQLAQFVLSKSSSGAINQMASGEIKLRDLNLEAQVRELLEVALSEPIHLPATQQAPMRLLEVQ